MTSASIGCLRAIVFAVSSCDWLASRQIAEEIMLKWRLLVEAGRKSGRTFSQPDLIIAATALHDGLTIVSRDTSEYEKANVPVLDPWLASG
jgi:predicted nucleic acid-binding protein